MKRGVLTTREAELLRLRQTYTNAQIGALQGIKPGTVQFYMHRIYIKLNVHSQGDAVVEAARRGML